MRNLATGDRATCVLNLNYLARVVMTPIGQLEDDCILFQEWREESSGEGKRTVIRMPDKLGALELIAKLSGELSSRPEVNAPVSISVIIGN